MKKFYSLFGFTVGNVNANNATGKGNRAARRAGWYVRPTAGPEYFHEIRGLMASI